MEKAGKKTQEDFKKFSDGMKKRLRKLGEDAGVWIKKGEVELSRISRIGKLELDIVNLNMKKDKLLKDIGNRVVEREISGEIGDPLIKNMCSEVKKIASQSRKKKTEISKTGKRLFKGKQARTKK